MATRKDLAQALGITKQRVAQLIKDGRIEEHNGSIDMDRALAAYQSLVDPMKRLAYMTRKDRIQFAEARAPALDFTAARTEKERANAQIAQLTYKIKAGHYIARDEVTAKEFAIARKIRDRILGFPARLANFVPPEAMKTITDECEALVREMQDEIAAIAESAG